MTISTRSAASRTAVDVATFEFENIDSGALAYLTEHVRAASGAKGAGSGAGPADREDLRPRSRRPTRPRSHPVDSEADLAAAARAIGTPGILKTRRFGYDGKGQTRRD